MRRPDIEFTPNADRAEHRGHGIAAAYRLSRRTKKARTENRHACRSDMICEAHNKRMQAWYLVDDDHRRARALAIDRPPIGSIGEIKFLIIRQRRLVAHSPSTTMRDELTAIRASSAASKNRLRSWSASRRPVPW